VPQDNKPSAASLPFAPGHFYSPIVDGDDPAVRRALAEEAQPAVALADFHIDEAEVMRWFERMAEHYDAPGNIAQPFPKDPSVGWRYHFDNPAFPLADALALLAFMAAARPRRYLEIGAGYSSCAALDISERYLGGAVEMAFIDPHPETFLELLAAHRVDCQALLPMRLQDVPLARFQALEAGDILFIDSSHVAKTGSDVLDYAFRVLPALRPGVLVHIHDIFSRSNIHRNGLWTRIGHGMRLIFCALSCRALPAMKFCISLIGFISAGVNYLPRGCLFV
jgi:predicted O-methyltransferase YrrM